MNVEISDQANEEDLQAIREGLEDVTAGRTQRFSEFGAELRKEMGFTPRASH